MSRDLIARLRNIAEAKAASNRDVGRKRKQWAREAEIEWQAADRITALEAEASEGERRGLERARLDAIVAWHGNNGTEWRRKDNGPTVTMTRPEEYVRLRALIPEAPAREGE